MRQIGFAIFTMIWAAIFVAPGWAGEPLRVVTTFSILADFAETVGGDRVNVTSLVGPNADPHGFDPSPKQQSLVAEAELLIANGLGLEPWLDRVAQAAGFKGRLTIASAGVIPLLQNNGAPDPHAFQAPALAKRYVQNIAAALSQIDPDGKRYYERRANDYIAVLQTAENEIRHDLATVSPAKRQVLSSHDAFGYFGRAFGITFLPIERRNDDEGLSAGDLAALIERARQGSIGAIFIENMVDPRLAETIAGDSGVRLGGVLYADSLSGPDGPAPNYLTLVRHNAATILGALR